jgi:hypothetical protein
MVGGGTTAVEALRLGRAAIVSDLNPLATFVTRVKTRRLSSVDAIFVRGWARQVAQKTGGQDDIATHSLWEDGGYFKDLFDEATTPLRHWLGMALSRADLFHEPVREFVRCVLLRTSQWALDMRSEVPTLNAFRAAVEANALAMVKAALAFHDHLPEGAPAPIVLHQRLPGLAERSELVGRNPKLILTSPPYPGVYVNYHRWKLRGRREIAAPYWIANCSDGHGIAHYTMHARSDRARTAYFDHLYDAFADVADLMGTETTLVQVVGFSQGSDHQLDRYLSVMRRAGLAEQHHSTLATADDGRLWRDVPGRRWWNTVDSRVGTSAHTSREVVLIHRLIN